MAKIRSSVADFTNFRYNYQMKKYDRIIPLDVVLKRKSVLLLGPRRTGKSFFITNQIKPDRIINLLEADTFRMFSARPEMLREIIQDNEKIIAID